MNIYVLYTYIYVYIYMYIYIYTYIYVYIYILTKKIFFSKSKGCITQRVPELYWTLFE